MSQTKKLSIAFYWHMHQPVYQLNAAGDFLMPWVRLHAIKDYLDMVLILEKHPDTKLNFNLVPVLLDALIDYGEKGFHDIHSRLTVMDIERLSVDDKRFIINNFFDANYEFMILPLPMYDKLYRQFNSTPDKDIDIFTNQEYSDLMALFNLAWFDPIYKDLYPELKKLIKKGKNYTLEDRIAIIDLQREIIRKIIPTYKQFMEAGKIEITTSPYYHPVLPILLDIKDAKKGNSDLPNNLNMESDAREQVGMALDKIEKLFGKRPKGLWPSEHCVSPKTLELLAEMGLKWTIADEGILSESVNHEFVRDFQGRLEDPYLLTKTYEYKTKPTPIKIMFRSAMPSALIGFEYYKHDPVTAAHDAYDKIKTVQSKLLSSPDTNHLYAVAMDGENCWEKYQEDGTAFLNTLYSLIEQDESLETVLLSDYITRDNSRPLNKLASGSWVNRNFDLWINEPLKNLAWSYLKRVKDDFTNYAKKNPKDPNLEVAKKELYICEGSDWFWWYGEPNDSGHDSLFDYIFREHLRNVYAYLGLQSPPFLETPLTEGISRPSRYPRGEFTPELTGNIDDEWPDAGVIEIPDGPVLDEDKLFDRICFGYDCDNVYFRFYANQYVKSLPAMRKHIHQMHIYTRCKGKKDNLSPIRVVNKTDTILPIAKEKFHNELQISLFKGEVFIARMSKALSNNLWMMAPDKGIEAAYDKVLDLAVPFELLGVEPGETVEFVFVHADYEIRDFIIPNDMLLEITRNPRCALR